MSGEWSNSLFGCFNDFGICIITYIIPCYSFGKNAEAVGESCCCCGVAYLFPVLHLVAGTSIRGKVRQEKGILGSMIGDFLTVLFCPFCAIVQEAQELRGDRLMGMARE
ncbi:uncharacterized protein LOC125678452 [Ostrea edulis]|uniref:uncharacterized protein LOC125678452 n=1 Tax=Ostrea edulis TaxID=37623 RepID=UPI0020955513|nr:uncharacterized protein LOC125678452 [Ostrea edulis]